MANESRYYQVGGFGSHILPWMRKQQNQWDLEPIAQKIAGVHSPIRDQVKGTTELILGMRPSGASVLLMTEDQMRTIARTYYLQYIINCHHAASFECLSPINFNDATALQAKLKEYQPKAGSRQKDTSKANKAFGEYNGSRPSRSWFEQQRVLHRILDGKSIDLQKFSVNAAYWSARPRVIALTYNIWDSDHRKEADRLASPIILDLGWAEMDLSTGRALLGHTEHITVMKNCRLRMRGSEPAEFKFGETAQLNETEIRKKLEQLLKQSEPGSPTVLLCFNEKQTRAILNQYVDVQSRWVDGISGVLYPTRAHISVTRERIYEERKYRSPPTDYRPDSHRSRSRSPRRNGESSTNRRDYETRLDNGGLSSESQDKLYVVDVWDLYLALTTYSESEKNFHTAARKLGIYPPEDADGWCAGNEAHMLLDMWNEMAIGEPIDDQRVRREAKYLAPSLPQTTLAVQTGTADVDDERVIAPPVEQTVWTRPGEDDYESDDDFA